MNTTPTNTNAQHPAKSAEERLANSYRGSKPSDQPPSTPQSKQTLTPEERLAADYRRTAPRAEPVGNPSMPPPPLTAEERLARTYGVETPSTATEEASDAEVSDSAEKAEGEGANTGHATEGDLRAPEGYVPLDTETASGLASIAKELELPDGAMQQLVDKVSPLLQERTTRNLQRMMDDWVEETTKDPEIGGARLDETISHARRALTKLGTPGLRKLLGPMSEGGTGIGNNREMVRFLARVGRELATSHSSRDVASD